MNKETELDFMPQRLKWACVSMKWLAVAAAIAMPVSIIAGGAIAEIIRSVWNNLDEPIRSEITYSDEKMIFLQIIAAITCLAPAFVMISAARVFSLLQKGLIFSFETAARIRIFASMVLASALVSFVSPTLLTLVMTMDNPPSKRALTFAIGSGHIVFVLIGVFLVAMAQILTHATRIEQENRQFV